MPAEDVHRYSATTISVHGGAIAAKVRADSLSRARARCRRTFLLGQGSARQVSRVSTARGGSSATPGTSEARMGMWVCEITNDCTRSPPPSTPPTQPCPSADTPPLISSSAPRKAAKTFASSFAYLPAQTHCKYGPIIFFPF